MEELSANDLRADFTIRSMYLGMGLGLCLGGLFPVGWFGVSYMDWFYPNFPESMIRSQRYEFEMFWQNNLFILAYGIPTGLLLGTGMGFMIGLLNGWILSFVSTRFYPSVKRPIKFRFAMAMCAAVLSTIGIVGCGSLTLPSLYLFFLQPIVTLIAVAAGIIASQFMATWYLQRIKHSASSAGGSLQR